MGSRVRTSPGSPYGFYHLIETLIFIYEEKRSIMTMIFWAWIGFMAFIGLMLTVCSFGEWGHIPVSIILALVIWILATTKW